jgi:hypothetical protein
LKEESGQNTPLAIILFIKKASPLFCFLSLFFYFNNLFLPKNEAGSPYNCSSKKNQSFLGQCELSKNNLVLKGWEKKRKTKFSFRGRPLRQTKVNIGKRKREIASRLNEP